MPFLQDDLRGRFMTPSEMEIIMAKRITESQGCASAKGSDRVPQPSPATI